jgi:hypothetical protein
MMLWYLPYDLYAWHSAEFPMKWSFFNYYIFLFSHSNYNSSSKDIFLGRIKLWLDAEIKNLF